MNMLTTGAKIVLCIDDEEIILSLLKSTLQAYGHRALVANGGSEGVEMAASGPVDAVILDYNMADMNGSAVAAEIRRVAPRAPILMFSGDRKRIPARGFALVDAFVEKPAEMKVLMSALSKAMAVPPPSPPPVRRFPRYPLQLPFELTASRRDGLVQFCGFSRDLGEGGIGGTIQDELVPDELVLLQVSDSLHPRARVRYRENYVYGLEFVGMTALEQVRLRDVCQQLATACGWPAR